MNQEAQFGLRFVVKDLAKMRKAMETVNKNLEKMQKTAGNATKNVDKLNTSFGNATRSVLRFGLAYFSISKIIGSVFSKATETAQLNTMATSAGVLTSQIGKLGKALVEFGGDARSAGSAYSSLTNIIGGARSGLGISEDIQRVNAMFGIGFNYGNISQDQLMTEIAKAMHRLKGNKNSYGINQIASAYGLSSDMAAFLAKYGAGWRSQVGSQAWSQMDEQQAKALLKSQEELKTAYERAVIELTPVIQQVLEWIKNIAPYLSDIAKVLNALFGWYVGVLDKAKKGGEYIGGEIGNWLGKRGRKEYTISDQTLREEDFKAYKEGALTEQQYLNMENMRFYGNLYRQGVISPQQYDEKRIEYGFKPKFTQTNGSNKTVIEINNNTNDIIKVKQQGNISPIISQ